MGAEFGTAFGPVTPSPPTHDEREHLEVLAALGEIREVLVNVGGALAALAAREPTTVEAAAPTDLAPLLAALDRPNPVPPSPEAVAEALARRLPDYGPTLMGVAEAMEAVGRNLERMNKKITAMSVMPSGGASGHVIVDSGQVSPASGSEFPWSSIDRARVDTLAKETTLEAINADIDVALSTRATEATLAAVATSVDTLEPLLSDVRAELRRRPVHKVATALAGVPAGVYVTVAEFTPAVAVTLTGYNADFQALAAAAYRMRLVLGSDAAPDVQHGEGVNTTANSWTPLRLDVAAGTRVAVQIIHDQITSHNVRGTVNYYEEP